MKQKFYTLDLRKYTDTSNPYGTIRGRIAHTQLINAIDGLPGASEIGISLANIEGADVSFFRECVIYAVKRYIKQISFYICDVTDEDILSNLHGAAMLCDQPLTCWVNGKCRFVGPEPSESSKAMLDYVIAKHETTTADAAAALDISVQNASTRFKRLTDDGFLLRVEVTAPSGGKEFLYRSIGKSA
jgi:hypothetical protein